ncbi:MAG TPA: thermonuclease family protein [Azospirillum sp.]|nr:thermonuclease family protein [Azospirillum sp.]
MRSPLLRSVLPALLMAAGPVLAGQASLPGPIPADVLDVLDGDTIAVRAIIWLGQAVETHVRLEGIDAPELRAHCAQEKEKAEAARALARRLLADGHARLLDVQADKYGGRVRARVMTSTGADLSQSLLDAGLAHPYRGEKRQPWCALEG